MSNALIVRIDVDDKGNPRIAKLGATAQKAKKDIAPLGDILKAVFASAAVLKGLQVLTQGIQNATRAQLEFNKAMATIKGITGVSGGALDALSDKARELAVNTEHSAANIAKAMLEVTKMGFDPDQTLKAMPAILDMSTAAMTDLQWTATNTLNVMKAFGLSTEETGRVTNVMTAALNKTSLNLEDYMDAMKYVGPVAKSMGMSLEEASAMLGLLADMSIKGTLGGTSVKNMLLNLLKPSEGVRVALADVNLEGKSLTEIMAVLKEKGVSVADMLDTFDKRAVTSALAVSDNAEAVALLEKHFKDMGITAAEAAEVIRKEAIENQLKNIMNIANEIGMSFFDAFGNKPQSFLEGIAEKLKQVDYWVDNNQDKIKQFGDVAFGALNLVVKGFELLIEYGSTLGSVLAGVFIYDKLNTWGTAFVNHLRNIATTAQSATIKLKVMSGIALGSSALAVGLSVLIDRTERWNEELDKANEKVSKDWFGTGHQKQLQDIVDQQKLINNFKATAGGFNSIADNDNKKKLKEMELALHHMVKAYQKDWDVPGLFGPKGVLDVSANALETRLKGINAHLEKIKTNAPFDPVTINPLSPGDLVNTDPDPEKAKKEEDRLQELMDNYEKNWKKEYTLQSQLLAINHDIRQVKERIKQIDDDETDRKKVLEISTGLRDNLEVATGLLSAYNDAQLSQLEQRLEAEKVAIDSRYNMEIALAGDSAFKKQIAEEKRVERELELEKKLAKEREKYAKREKMIRTAQATADMIAGIINVMYRQPGELFTKLGAGLAYSAIVGGYISQLAAINLREGTKGPFDGKGNSTSDSIPAWVSKGEWLLSKNDVSRLGGPQKIQQMLDRGTTYNNSRNMTIQVGTVIGTRQFVRDELIPTINKELSR